MKQLAVTNLNSNFTNSMYSAVLSIVGFVVMIVFFLLFFPVKSIKRSVDNVSERNLFSGILFILSIVSVLLLFVIVAYTIMTSIPLSTGFITSPTSTFSGQLTLGIAFYLITAYFLFGILFAVFLVLHFFRSKLVGFRRLYSLILIIPIVAIGYNILSSTNRIEIINSMIDSHNLNMAGQLIRQDATEIVLNTRTMYLFSLEENDISLEDLNLSGIVSETDFGIYNLAVNGNLLTINGEGKYKNVIGEGVQVKTLFYADRDSINTQLIK